MWRVGRYGGRRKAEKAASRKIYTCSHSVCTTPNFNFLARLVSDIWRESQNKKIGTADLTRRHLADKILYRALLLVNDYQCAKFQLASCISFGDMERSQDKNWGLLTYPDAP